MQQNHPVDSQHSSQEGGFSALHFLQRHYLQRLPQKLDSWHEFWLRRCLELARRGLGRAAPNPLVGAVLLRPRPAFWYPKDSKGSEGSNRAELLRRLAARPAEQDWQQYFVVLGEGYHAAYGQLHAEAAAFAAACEDREGDLEGAILYCNLEPCGFSAPLKKQPPCCDQIIARKVALVVCANTDPYPAVAGKGLQRLRQAGIAVECGHFARPAASINQGFFHSMRAQKPWVSLKLAQSLDGCIATKSGHSQWLTGPRARQLVQALRTASGPAASAVAVGRQTLEADNPSLLLRPSFQQQLAAGAQQPIAQSEDQSALQTQNPQQVWRLVWDSQLKSAGKSLQFYCGPQQSRSIAVYHSATAERESWLRQQGVNLLATASPLHSAEGLRQGLAALCRQPYAIQNLLLEGGAQLASSFVCAGLIDELYCFISPRLLGSGLSSLGDLFPAQSEVQLEQAPVLQQFSAQSIAEESDWPDELLCHGYLSSLYVPQE